MRKILSYSFFILLGINCSGQKPENGNQELTGPYFGQKTPGLVPEVFGKGIISISDSKYCTISFSGRMDEFYLYRWNGTKAEILHTKLENGIWTPLQEAGFTAGYKAMEPHITFNGKRIFFNWDKPVPPGQKETPFKIWFTERTSTGWSEPGYAGSGMFVSSDSEGNIYTTDMTSAIVDGKTYLSRVKTENKKFVGFERLSIPQYYGSQAHPCIAPDGSFIIFDVDSGHHLFISFKGKDGTWDNAIDLTKNGFDPMAGGASVTPDGKYLFFSCKGQLMWVDALILKKLKAQ
jgi:hypothetical protein